jgi:hypothetical protein
MQTRSITDYENKCLYKVNIDFDEASTLWRSNKFNLGNGMYRYICIQKNTKGNMCIKKCLQGEEYCKVHLKMLQKK